MYIPQRERYIAYLTFKSVVKEITSYNVINSEENVWKDIYGIALKQYVRALKKAAK